MKFRDIFSGIGDKYREGQDKARADVKGDREHWQIELETLDTWITDSSIPDETVVNEYFNFMAKHKDKAVLESVSGLLERILDTRPSTATIFKNKLDNKEN